MVARKNLNNKFVLISVYNKKNLKYLCKNLEKHGYKFIATGSTYNQIIKYGFKCLKIAKVTKFKEILEGRVKTLNPKIFGSILFKRNNTNHIKDFEKLRFPEISIVVVNLYPFNEFLKNNNEQEIIEMIDIGGASLVRAASKNFADVTIVSKIGYYPNLIKNLEKNNGKTDVIFRKNMAKKSFKNISDYDSSIFKWFNNKNLKKKKTLRYGENPSQNAFIINKNKKSVFNYQINGKELSYNNIIDVDSGVKCIREFSEPTCVIIKHTNPCGVSSSKNINDAYRKAYESDKKSSFGGIVVLNRKVNFQLANKIIKNFFEVIVAKSFDKKALNILKNKKNLILLKIDNLKPDKQEFRSTIFGPIYQNLDLTLINKSFLKLASYKKSNKKNLEDLIFSLKIVKHLKSNAIVLSSNKQTVGIGIGQVNRINALKLAINHSRKIFKNKKFVCASDGFFPFVDAIKLLKKNKCNNIAQPSGSINDKNIIEYANINNLSLYFIKNRLFKH